MQTTLPTSAEFAANLLAVYNKLKQEHKEAGVEKPPSLWIHLGAEYASEVTLSIRIYNGYGAEETKGKELWVVSAEHLRRLGFVKQQEQLQLAAPVVDNEAAT